MNAKALVFSVKGEDLLFLDHANARLDDELRARYARLGLPAEPFASVGFFAPPTPDDPTGRPYVTGRTSGVAAFWWTLAEFCAGELLPYVFADAEDERNQYTMVIHQVAARLRAGRRPVGRRRGRRSTGGRCAPTTTSSSSSPTSSPTRTPAATGPARSPAPARSTRSCAGCAPALKPLRTLVRGDLPDLRPAGGSSTENQQVTVVDLHNLPERAQRFVVGVVLAAETARKEAAGTGGLLFTMIDELNKYAPREGSSPIKEVLLDIAERGRSLGIILIGAQQTASEVERRIVSNSSIKVVGPARPGRGRAARVRVPAARRSGPGRCWRSRARCSSRQPEIPVPLAVEFPFPAWATRLSESAGEPRRTNGSAAPRPVRPAPGSSADDDDAPF